MSNEEILDDGMLLSETEFFQSMLAAKDVGLGERCLIKLQDAAALAESAAWTDLVGEIETLQDKVRARLD